ncbi:hypothetical protein [Paenibacillus apis]|uniref:ABC transporter substrate-binding protein n=1 Tax=Paenibacillus apis TaxID=1792174 RepID=A0A920CKG5_9BACL|nr:hypothetical protein [Paenibacillus apis]GIO40648.1 hypothetical protein J41TS4_04060 [Paenibacillus apis]
MKAGKRSASFVAGILALLLLIVTACSSPGAKTGNEAQGGTGKPNESSGEASSGDSNTFNLWLGWTATINNDSLIQKYWKEEEPGIQVELEAMQGDAMTALNLRLNTGGFKDAAIFSRSETVKNAMIRSGQVMALEQYFEMPDKYPNLAAIPKEYLERMRDTDGHIWSIPTWFDQNPDEPWPGWVSTAWLVRTDVVEKTGMKLEDLASLEGIESFLKKAAEQKDESGKALNPMGFLMDQNDSAGWNDENAVLSAFGVTTGSAGGVIPVEEKNGEFVFLYDDPGYKAAYQWISRMYREKLIDPEVVTDKKERYKEKNKSGRTAMNVGSFWNVDQTIWETLDGPTESGWYYEPIAFPKVNGVESVGYNQIVNPYPGYDVYISESTKNLEAILKFLDYTLQPKAEMQQIVNEGPAGLYWDWIDQPLGSWKYIDEAYSGPRNSGDAAQKATVTPELYMLASFNYEWYPWWNNEVSVAGAAKTQKFSKVIGQMGGVRTAHLYDTITAKPGSLWEKYGPELENLRKEYRAKLIMSKDDAQFEEIWQAFRDALEKRVRWSELKQEWHESYQALVQENGEY